MVDENAIDLGAERVQVLQILDADRAAADLVFVSRTDATPGGADLAVTGRRFTDLIEFAMERQDQRRVFGDPQVVLGDDDVLGFELVDFGGERPGIDDDAIADHGELAGADDAGGQERQLVDVLADDEGVAGVMSTLEADHHIGALRQPIDDLAFALIAPLGANNHDVGHVFVL